jgi:hypothetical protein
LVDLVARLFRFTIFWENIIVIIAAMEDDYYQDKLGVLSLDLSGVARRALVGSPKGRAIW